MTCIVCVTFVSANVIEYWVKAKVSRFSISRLEFSLLSLPHTFDSFYTLPNQRYRPSSFSMEQPLSKYFNQFYFHRKRRFKTKTRKPRTDIGKLEKVGLGTMADFWSEKDVGFIGPITFLSDLTVGPTYFVKSAQSLPMNSEWQVQLYHIISVG